MGPANDLSPDALRLLSLYETLSEDRKQLALQMIRVFAESERR